MWNKLAKQEAIRILKIAFQPILVSNRFQWNYITYTKTHTYIDPTTHVYQNKSEMIANLMLELIVNISNLNNYSRIKKKNYNRRNMLKTHISSEC